MRSVSVFYYSMTGQCEAVARAIADALPDCEVHPIRVRPTEPRWQLGVPFRPMWRTFFGTLLPTVRGDAMAIETDPPRWPEADLVVVNSATWWNRPCLPVQNLVRSEEFRAYVKGKPVGLLATCRGAYRNNLDRLGEAVTAAGGRVVARERLTFTGTLLGTFLTFFALLRFGSPQRRWLGLDLPPYGLLPATLAKARAFARRVRDPSAWEAQGAPDQSGLVRAVRLLYLCLALLDLALGISFTFFGAKVADLAATTAYAEPRFFQRCAGLFLFQYVYVQFMAYRDPRAFSTCLNMTVFVRATFPVLYLGQLALWGSPFTLLHWLFLASAAGDVATAAFTLFAMRRLGIRFFQGDAAAHSDAPSSGTLRWMLLVLALAEFLISWNWLLLPKFWCGAFGIAYAVDPFWTRATGLFLVNIAYIQFLGFRDPRRYRTAAVTSGVFRALWPVLYWVTTASGEGNALFRVSIMFFSFFDLFSCIAIFWLLHRVAVRDQLAPSASY
ncbi:MAG TPA: hypothetical protein VIV57_06900 [Anaeromyxobacter sp.]